MTIDWVECLAIWGKDLLIGGAFEARLMKWNSESGFSNFTTTNVNDWIRRILILNNVLHVAGDFSNPCSRVMVC